MTDNSGLKVGLGATALGAASVYATPKMTDMMTKVYIKGVRNSIKDADVVIKAGKDALRNSAGNLLVDDMAKAVYEKGLALKKSLYNSASDIFNLRRLIKNTNLLKQLMIATPLYIGCGAIVDWANRKQRAKSAPNATTKNGNEYTKVNMGKKLGAVLGIAAGAVSALADKNFVKKALLSSPNKAISIATSLILMTVGGFTMGAIADKISNKKAAKAADKAAM